VNLSIKALLIVPTAIGLVSCANVPDSPKGCVTSFIIAVEQHDMSKAWGLMGSDAQKYYNGLGEKQRRSGKGAFEREVNEIKSFFNADKDYTFQIDKENSTIVKLVLTGGKEFDIETIDDGGYKIKNEIAVKKILNVIAEKIEKEEYY
jgi:hypothetical protein